MLYIVHGENLSYSRNIILNQQKKLGFSNRTEIDISEVTPQQLKDMTMSFDLFGKPPFIVFNISGAGRMKLDEYVEALKRIPEQTTLIILSDKELSKTNAFIKNRSEIKAKIVLGQKKPSANIFKFIDFVYNKKRNQAYKELKNLLIEDQDPFYLFSMLIYGLRNIAFVKYGSPQTKKMSPFVKARATSQKRGFSDESFLRLYKELYELDKSMKTGIISSEVVIPYAVEKILNA